MQLLRGVETIQVMPCMVYLVHMALLYTVPISAESGHSDISSRHVLSAKRCRVSVNLEMVATSTVCTTITLRQDE